MAKGIGNGFPLAAVCSRREIAEKLAKKLYFNTFGGNPIACVVGHEILKIIDEEKLMDNVKRLSPIITNYLKKFEKKYRHVGNVRGTGFM